MHTLNRFLHHNCIPNFCTYWRWPIIDPCREIGTFQNLCWWRIPDILCCPLWIVYFRGNRINLAVSWILFTLLHSSTRRIFLLISWAIVNLVLINNLLEFHLLLLYEDPFMLDMPWSLICFNGSFLVDHSIVVSSKIILSNFWNIVIDILDNIFWTVLGRLQWIHFLRIMRTTPVVILFLH